MAGVTGTPERWLAISIVSLTVVIQLVSALILSAAAENYGGHRGIAIAAIGAAIALNVLRFLLWGVAHKRFPLSRTYPLTALFFPLLLLLSFLQGDSIGVVEIAGTMLITGGVVMVGMRGGEGERQ